MAAGGRQDCWDAAVPLSLKCYWRAPMKT